MRKVLLFSLLLTGTLHAQRIQHLAISGSAPVEVLEPSDLTMLPDDTMHFFVASDHGTIEMIDRAGRIVRSTGPIGYDFEACTVHDGRLLVADERTRRVCVIDPATMKVLRQVALPYSGGRNKGYEAMAWNSIKKCYVLLTERDPVTIFELDTALHVVNEAVFDRSVRDVSAAAWSDDALWLLSDMDRLLLRCDPIDYHIITRYDVPIINPEGLTIDAHRLAWVISDDRQRLYSLPLPQ